MCGAILRSVRGVEVDAGSIDLSVIESVVSGPGHYLGESQTLSLMKSEYVYPRLSDRQSISQWQEGGGKTIWDRAVERVRELESLPDPTHLPTSREAAIRAAFPIRLVE